MSSGPNTSRYPLLEEMLALRGMTLQATYNNRDLARLFGVSTRSIQDWSASGLIGDNQNSRSATCKIPGADN